MRPIKTFTVVPAIPEKLSPLLKIACNLRWSWQCDAVKLFRRMDPETWEKTRHNPVAMLGKIDQSRLNEMAQDKDFLDHLQRVDADLNSYLDKPGWWSAEHGRDEAGRRPLAAFFCAEYGVTDCIPLYAGGLGILAGDYLKSASDLDMPIVSVGLLYQQGYFRQRLNADGWQLELFPRNDFYNLPIELLHDDEGAVVTVHIPMPERNITARVWQVRVGRVNLYMLDTNIPANPEPYRHITGQLYGGDREMRIRQEIVLGIGGVRLLETLGIRPDTFHMNEGHSAFLALERIRSLMAGSNLSFSQAREAVAASNIFTTHTPVPAGNDAFEPWLIDKYFSNYWDKIGLTRKEFLALGRQEPNNPDEPMSLTVLAMKLSEFRNGVSQLHGQVSRRLWSGIWPGAPEHEVPITAITDGIHTPSWISPELAALFDHHLGRGWHEKPLERNKCRAIGNIPDSELWKTHNARKKRLIEFTRRRLREQLTSRGAPRGNLAETEKILDPEALTIVFARRFATYKRAYLILEDTERLAKILNDEDRPVQIIFAGKGHPMDKAGKELIRRIIHVARQEQFRRSMVFIEDYDVNTARLLVQGCDVWLNTPLRPMEASGTSGMKAAANGGLNLSIPDGWWAEGFDPEVGWSIGGGEKYDDLEYQNSVESQAIYDLLEKEIVPIFYDRGRNKLPKKWVAMMKQAIIKLAPQFDTNRMILEYCENFYLPAAELWKKLSGDNFALAGQVAEWKKRLRDNFKNIAIENVTDNMPAHVVKACRSRKWHAGENSSGAHVGENVRVDAVINLGGLSPDDVSVEIYYGPPDEENQIRNGRAEPMEMVEDLGNGKARFEGEMPCQNSGHFGYTVRVVPRHPLFDDKTDVSLIRWA